VLMAQALKTAFAERVPPPIPEGMSYLSDEGHLSSGLEDAGLENVQVGLEQVRQQLLELVKQHSVGDEVRLRSAALIALGQRP
jgi:hypothetical protein